MEKQKHRMGTNGNSKNKYIIDNFKDELMEYFVQGERIMKHIVSFSGVKDSTAMLLRMLEEDMQIDDIIFCDVGKDFPDMLEHVAKLKKYIKEK